MDSGTGLICVARLDSATLLSGRNRRTVVVEVLSLVLVVVECYYCGFVLGLYVVVTRMDLSRQNRSTARQHDDGENQSLKKRAAVPCPSSVPHGTSQEHATSSSPTDK